MTPPRWLQDEAEIKALLHAALNRFDQLPAQGRQRATLLSAEQQLPSLQQGGLAADQTWSLIGDLASLQVLSIREGRRSAYDPAWRAAKLAFDAQSEVTLREWLQRPATSKPMQEWRAAVRAYADRFVAGHAPLLERRIAIANRTAEEVVRALAGIGLITTSCTLRQLSSHAFWGDSKVLDERGDLIAALFPHLKIRERAIVVAVYLPQHIQGVLFIENQDTYTTAMQGEPVECQHHALVYLSGFKGTALRIREPTGARLHFAGAGVKHLQEMFCAWWFDRAPLLKDISFWGDLDFAGMQMLKSLRERFGDVAAWPTGYAPMLRRVQSRQAMLAPSIDRQQLDPSKTGCRYADESLLPAIRSYGFCDQEHIAE